MTRLQRHQMHGYQKMLVDWMYEHPFGFCLVDMGLGKTVSTLTVVERLLTNFEADRVLVIGPLRVALDTWPAEIKNWQHTSWITFTQLAGLSEPERKVAAKQRTQIHIINREMVDWLVQFHGPRWPYRVVIIDESDSFKSHQSERFKALAKVRHTPGLIERLYLLTATPAAESYIGLWAQTYLLDLGKRLGKSITKYRDSYFTQNRYTYTYKIRPGAEEAILDKIKDIAIVMKAEDYLPRDKPTLIKVPVTLDQKTYDLIKHLQKHFIMTLPDGTELEAKTAAALASMVLQMASGTVYETELIEDIDTEDLRKVKKVHHLHNCKIEVLREIVEEAKVQGTPLLVAYWFKSSLDRLVKAFPKAEVMGQKTDCVKRWNAGKIDMLLIHPQSAGHGLNLQYGGNHLVFFDLCYSLGYYLQTIGRIDRQGQTKPVIVRHLVATGTRDELVYDLLAQKADAQEKLFRILKRLIAKYRKNKKNESSEQEEEHL